MAEPKVIRDNDLDTIESACEVATQKGAYTMKDISNIFTALSGLANKLARLAQFEKLEGQKNDEDKKP
ncbi:MAG: hypothetical protein ACUZ8H_16410 [Candidatus Anammoxibacter sp.]